MTTVWEGWMGAVYMLASRKHGTLYVGVTSDLLGRIAQHRDGVFDGLPTPSM